MSFELESFIQAFGQVTESYFFYNGQVELRYAPVEHVYYLVNGEELEKQEGISSVAKIIDKSDVLMNWSVKMMAQRLFEKAPVVTLPSGDKILGHLSLGDFETLVLEAKNAHKERKEEAGKVGHIAHDWIEKYIKSVLAGNESLKLQLLSQFPSDDRAKNACLAALEWMSKHNVRWIETERKVYSRKYRFAGTMDGLCTVDSCEDPNCCPNLFRDRLTVADWKTSNYLYLEYLLQTAGYEQAYEEEFGVDIQDRWVIRLGKDDGEFDPWHVESETFAEDFGAFLMCLELGRAVARIDARIKAKARAATVQRKAEKQAAKALKDAADKAAKALAKETKQQARAEAVAKACTKSKTYKGTRKPTCTTNGGGACVSCTLVYATAQAGKEEVKVQPKVTAVKVATAKKVMNLTDLLLGDRLLLPMKVDADLGKEWNVTTKQIMECMVVPAQETVRCDGEHGEPECASTMCWHGDPSAATEGEIARVTSGEKPQLLLMEGRS